VKSLPSVSLYTSASSRRRFRQSLRVPSTTTMPFSAAGQSGVVLTVRCHRSERYYSWRFEGAEMNKMIFMNVGWMSEYSGPGQISGGGKYVTIHGYGHEMMNFKPFTGKMYGTAPTPSYGDINLERLGAVEGAEFVDGVLVVWMAKSRIVGWYKNARVYRHPQPSPKSSGRSYKGSPIDYRVTALASNCTLLDPDNRHFPVCVGTNCLKKSQRMLSVFAYNDTSRGWVDGSDRLLEIAEVKSARLRLLPN